MPAASLGVTLYKSVPIAVPLPRTKQIHLPRPATSAWLPYWDFQVLSLVFKGRTEREGIVPPHSTRDPIF